MTDPSAKQKVRPEQRGWIGHVSRSSPVAPNRLSWGSNPPIFCQTFAVQQPDTKLQLSPAGLIWPVRPDTWPVTGHCQGGVTVNTLSRKERSTIRPDTFIGPTWDTSSNKRLKTPQTRPKLARSIQIAPQARSAPNRPLDALSQSSGFQCELGRLNKLSTPGKLQLTMSQIRDPKQGPLTIGALLGHTLVVVGSTGTGMDRCHDACPLI